MVTASVYDSMSRLTNVTVNRIAGVANAADVNLDTSYTYDQLGRRLTTTDPLGHVSAAEWDCLGRQLAGNANYVGGGTTKTDSQNLTSVASYDDLGHLLATCDPQAVKAELCAGSPTDPSAWHYGYDAMGHLVRADAPVNQTLTALASTSFEYDAAKTRVARDCRLPAAQASSGGWRVRKVT